MRFDPLASLLPSTPSLAARSLPMRGSALLCASLFVGACGGAGTATDSARPTGVPEGWAETLFVAEGNGPSLFNGPEAGAAAIGYVGAGVQVRVVGAPQGDRIPVRIDGLFKVRAWLPLARLGGRVQRRGKLRGAPISLGVNDIVGVRGSADGGRMIVEARPRFGRTPEPAIGPFEGTFPARGIGAAVVAAPPAARGAVERARLPAGRAVELFDRPGGRVVATIPPLERGLTVEVARRRGDWSAVRAGIGPFLIGWVRGALEAPDAEDLAASVDLLVGSAAPHAGPPRLLQNDATMPLWRVRTRARVRFDGVTVGRLGDRGWAREMRRTPDGEVDVFVAVDDDVAVRGMVNARELEPVEPGAIPQAPETGATAQPPANAPLSGATSTP